MGFRFFFFIYYTVYSKKNFNYAHLLTPGATNSNKRNRNLLVEYMYFITYVVITCLDIRYNLIRRENVEQSEKYTN